MKKTVIILIAIAAVLVLSVYFYGLHFILSCMGPDEILIWGNTFRFGFTTYELQCYRGRFA
jgi:hypothetical protein